MITGQANFLHSLGWAVINSLWQMALLWVVYQLISGIARSARSSFRSSLASLLLITGFALFIFTFFSVYGNTSSDQTILSASMLFPEENHSFAGRLQLLFPIASVLYLALLILPLANFIRNYRYVQVIRQYGLAKTEVQWRIFVKEIAARMGIRKPVHIWISDFVSSPVTIGFLKPVILVPLAAINHLSSQQMEAVLLHELAHIRRYDYLVNLVINIIKTILYFNPFVKAFLKIVEREREKSCDEMVLQFQYDSYEYATALLTLEKNNSEFRPLAIGITGKKNDLLHRIEMIMGVNRKSTLSFNKIAGVFAGLIFMIAVNALLFFGKQPGGRTTGNFATLSSPFNFFATPASKSAETTHTKEVKFPLIANSLKETSGQEKERTNNGLVPLVPDQGVIYAGYEPVEGLHLKKFEEAQVKAAMDASKKVLENEEWKALEKTIADVFTQKEKDELESTYQKELEKMDWKKWENKLRLAYDQLNWNKINEQLAKAVNNIRIDSLQKVYKDAISQLDITRQELTQNNLQGIPDTDITLRTIEKTKQQVQKNLNRIKAVRNKKVVHL